MNLRSLLAGALLVALCHVGEAQARDQLGQRDPVVVDPQRAYIFYRASQRLDVRLMREVDEAERAEWDAARRAAFPRARQRNEREIAEWDRTVRDCTGNYALSAYCQNRGTRPVPLTLENFPFAVPELDNFLIVMGGRQFTRTETENTYFIAVEPGTYAIYGQATIVPSGSMGICLCMGSVRFETRAGEIVDLGEVHFPRADALRARRNGGEVPSGRLASMAIVPPNDGMSLPDRLAGLPVVRAELRAANKVPNYFALEIDRLPAVPGVLDYQRDVVIDARTGAPVTPAP